MVRNGVMRRDMHCDCTLKLVPWTWLALHSALIATPLAGICCPLNSMKTIMAPDVEGFSSVFPMLSWYRMAINNGYDQAHVACSSSPTLWNDGAAQLPTLRPTRFV